VTEEDRLGFKDLTMSMRVLVMLLRGLNDGIDLPAKGINSVSPSSFNSMLYKFCTAMTKPPHSAHQRELAYEALSYLLPAKEWRKSSSIADNIQVHVPSATEERTWLNLCDCFNDSEGGLLKAITKAIMFGCKSFQPIRVRVWATRCLAHFCAFSAMGICQHPDTINGPYAYLLATAGTLQTGEENAGAAELRAAAVYGLASLVLALHRDIRENHLKDLNHPGSEVLQALRKMVSAGMRDLLLGAVGVVGKLPSCVRQHCLNAYDALANFEASVAWSFDLLSEDARELVPKSFICGISHEPMRDPVMTCDGQTYDRKAIQKWFATGRSTSPLTNQPLRTQNLIPNIALRQSMEEWIDNTQVENCKKLARLITNATSFDELLAAVNKITKFVAKNGAVMSRLECQRVLDVADTIFRSLEQEKLHEAAETRRRSEAGQIFRPAMNVPTSSFSSSAAAALPAASSSSPASSSSSSAAAAAPAAAAAAPPSPFSMIVKPRSPRLHGTSQLVAVRKGKLENAKETLRAEVVRALRAAYVQVNALSILESARSDAVAESSHEIDLSDRIRERSKLAVKDATERELRAKRVFLDLKAEREKLERALLEAGTLCSSRKSDQDELVAMEDRILDEKSNKRKCLLDMGERPPPCDSGPVCLPPVPDLQDDERESEEEQADRKKRKRSSVMPPTIAAGSPGPEIKKRRMASEEDEDGAPAAASPECGGEASQVADLSEGKWLFEEGHAVFFGLCQHAVDRVRGRLMIVAACRLKFPLACIMCLHYGWANEVRDITPRPDMANQRLCELRLREAQGWQRSSSTVEPLLIPKEEWVPTRVILKEESVPIVRSWTRGQGAQPLQTEEGGLLISGYSSRSLRSADDDSDGGEDADPAPIDPAEEDDDDY
jgi:hypothetical protein